MWSNEIKSYANNLLRQKEVVVTNCNNTTCIVMLLFKLIHLQNSRRICYARTASSCKYLYGFWLLDKYQITEGEMNVIVFY